MGRGLAETELLLWYEPRKRRSEIRPDPPTREPLFPSLRLLVVEDNVVNQKFATRALEKAGHSVVVANNGKEAVAAWLGEVFDVVLMDVQMPVMDGYAATGEIRRREMASGRRTPIIAMTANDMAGDREKCIDSGMDGYVTKPIDSRVLLAEVTRHTPRSADENRRAFPEGMTRSTQEVFDGLKLLEDLDDDRDFIEESIAIFEADAPELLGEVRGAIDQGDAELLRRGAHTLKSMVGNFCAQPAIKAAAEMEQIAIDGELADGARRLENLELELDRLTEALHQFLKETE